MKPRSIKEHIKDGKLKVWVKPNSSQNKILGYKKGRDALVVRVSAPPSKGEANKELTDFLSEKLNRRVVIKSGSGSRKKLLEVL